MRGVPRYSQNTVAWPNNPRRRGELDDINVNFSASGGGTHGEFRIAFGEFEKGFTTFGRRATQPWCKVVAFDDGMNAMLEPRCLAVLQKIAKSRKTPTPEKVIGWLEEAGIGLSWHHLQGRLERGDGSYEQRQAWKQEIDRQRKRENE